MKNRKAIALAEPYIIDRILPLVKGTSKQAMILDLATGQGYILERLAELGYKNLYGADIDPSAFVLNKKTFHYQQVDANMILPYKSSFFDIVISSETIEHLENPRHFIREVNRILKPKGQFITSTPSVDNIFSRLYFLIKCRPAFHTPNDYNNGHITIMPTWLLDNFCHDANLKLISRTYSSCYIPILKIRIQYHIFLNKFFGWITISNYKKIK